MNALTNEEWIHFLFDKLPEGATPWVCGFPTDPKSKPNWTGRAYRRPKPNDAFGGFAQTWNNYLSVASIKEGGRRHGACFAAMHAFMIDDLGSKLTLNNLALPPSLLLETSPGNYQAWYKLDPPIADQVAAASLIAAAIAKLGGGKDPGMAGAVRYGRLPVGSNTKGGGCFAHVAQFTPIAYSAEQIIEAYGLVLNPVKPKPLATKPEHDQDLSGWLYQLGMVRKQYPDGSLELICPRGDDDDGHRYYPPSEANWWRGGVSFFHGKCQCDTVRDLKLTVAKAAAERGLL